MAPFSKIKEMARNYMAAQANQTQNLPSTEYLAQEDDNINFDEANSSSSAPRKKKTPKVVPRGRNKCKKAAHLEFGKKLKVAFYEGRVVGENANEFTRYLGKIVCNPHICPIRVHKWEEYDDDQVEHMWAVVQEKFESEDMELERTAIIEHMQELWRKWRGQLFQAHVKDLSLGFAIRSVPKNMDKNDWEWLVRAHYHSDKYKKIGGQNSQNRSHVTMPHRTGSKPFRQIKYDMGGKCGKPPSFEKFWFETHKSGDALDKPETREKHEMIKRTIEHNPEMETFDVIESCFGPQNKGNVAGYGGSVKPKDIRGALPSRSELQRRLKESEKANEALLGRLEVVETENKLLSNRFIDLEVKLEGRLQSFLDSFNA